MDTLDVTGMVMTGALNSVITDSSPGMAAYATGQKNNNNQEGVFPDNTPDAFDNPRIEYLGELLRRTRGAGFNTGIVTTADVTDSTPAANAVHTSNRSAGAGIAAQFFDERGTNGVAVLMGGGSRHFMPLAAGGERTDDRRLAEEFVHAGYTRVSNATEVSAALGAAPPPRLLGLFNTAHLPVAFDKVGAGRYSDELARPANAAFRDTPMLEDLARLALHSLSAHSPAGFYLMIEGASIDKRAHAVDAERMIWDVIEFDRAVQVALDFAEAYQQRRGSVQRHARDRDGRSRDRRTGTHRGRQRAVRARIDRPGRSRLRGGVSVRNRSTARFPPQLHDRRQGVSARPGPVQEAAAGLGGGTRPQ